MIVNDKLMQYIVFQKRTTSEVIRKCQALGIDEDTIDEIIDYLTENEYLNDEKYVIDYILSRIKAKKKSLKEISFSLLKKGIDNDLIKKYMTDELVKHEMDLAIELAQKKFKSSKDVLAVKRYLMGKGFNKYAVDKAIEFIKEIDSKEIARG